MALSDGSDIFEYEEVQLFINTEMLEKTRGIIIHHIRYGESSIIAHVYTETRGRQSFIFKGIRLPKSRMKANLIQPLFVVSMDAYFKDSRDLNLVKEISLYRSFNFPYDIRKSSQALFISEILHKTLKEENRNPELFDFLINSIDYFDLSQNGTSNFHIFFLVKLMRYLGILPSPRVNKEVNYFDMKEGEYQSVIPDHPEYLEPFETRFLQYLLSAGYPNLSRLKMNHHDRQVILERILRFYAIHIEGMDRLRSYAVLKEVFEGSGMN